MDFSRVLEDDLKWREAELASLKRIAISNRSNETVLMAILRSCWALLYAHFEGFTKFCWELLLDQVQDKNVTVKELSKEFQILALEESFKKIRGNSSSHYLFDFFNLELPEEIQKKAIFSENCRLETGSNLWPNLFEQECEKIGIKSNVLDSYRPRIKSLVSRRNDIAHGKKMVIKSINEYSEYEHVTLLVLYDLAVQVLEIIEKQSYKNAN